MTLIDERRLERTIVEATNRWPTAGLAVGVVRDGVLAWFLGQGVADTTSRVPIMRDTVFRIASVTKTFTAVAVMQLWEQGLVDLDVPADTYLRTFNLTPAKGVSMPTVRHLLTHTSGIGYWRRLSDVLHPGPGSGDTWRGPAPSLADYYRGGLTVEVEPGTKWVYSNHGFAVLGQIVEDITGEPIQRYLRDHIFEPLGMDATALTLPVETGQLATGYAMRSDGPRPVPHHEMPLPAAGGAYSTITDLSGYLGALLQDGSGKHGTMLKPETLALMFAPQYGQDDRMPLMGLGFMRGEEGGHRTIGHDGILSGFLSALSFAPDDALGVVVLSNTGRLDGRGAPAPLASALLRQLLDLPPSALRTDVPQRPDVWGQLCGWYGMDPGPVTNMFSRLLMGAGAEVRVDRGRLVLMPLTPLPPMRAGFQLYPDDPTDPYVFRIDASPMGFSSFRVVFAAGNDGQPMRLLLNGMSFEKRPGMRNPRAWTRGLLVGGAAALAWRGVRRRARRVPAP